MKIGIVTCWQPDDNYGTQIQCFALQKYLRSLGHDAYLIRYKRFEDVKKAKITFLRILKIFNPYIVVRHLYYSLIAKRKAAEIKNHNRKSPEFRDKYLKMTDIYETYTDLKNNPPIADLYIVGSDQVWNINIEHKNNIGVHFLNFGDVQTKRISYAASFGFSSDKLDLNFAYEVFPLLKKFSGISVRELSGIQICEKISDINKESTLECVQVCDPTMLLNQEQYLEIFKDEIVDIPSKPYVFVYNIAAPSELNINYIKKWAEKQNLQLVYTMGHGKTSKLPHIYPSVPEWIKLIANAQYVITNSFHGTVFSLLFHRQCAVYPIKLKTPTNTRLDTLINLCEQNIIVSKENTLEKALSSTIDWNKFEKNKDNLKKIGINFLNKYII